jgi:hypothetical protein
MLAKRDIEARGTECGRRGWSSDRPIGLFVIDAIDGESALDNVDGINASRFEAGDFVA